MRDPHGTEFDDFVRTRSVALLRVAYLLTGDRHAAEDLLQEVLEQVYVRWRRVRTSPEAYARRAATPDGRRLLVQTVQYDDDPARVVVLLARGDAPFHAAASGFLDWTAPLPVRLRLPDGQGVLVAAEGAKLSYRVGAGRWHDAGRGAALLPADTTEVRVTPAGGTATTVPVTP